MLSPQLRLPGIVSLAESCTPSVFTDAGMLDGEMLLPNAVAPEHAAAVSGPAHRPSETPIAISTPRAPIHAAARAVPSDQHASCGGAENFSPCPVAEEAPGHARPATVCDLIPLVRHTLIHSGTSLRHHYVSRRGTPRCWNKWAIIRCTSVSTSRFLDRFFKVTNWFHGMLHRRLAIECLAKAGSAASVSTLRAPAVAAGTCSVFNRRSFVSFTAGQICKRDQMRGCVCAPHSCEPIPGRDRAQHAWCEISDVVLAHLTCS
jgi:hypothetical protein